MIEIQHTCLIDRPVAEVSGFVTDPTNNPRWQPFVVEARVIPDGPVRVGARVHESIQFLGRHFDCVFEVTELEPGRASAILFLAGPVWGTARYGFEQVGAGTSLTVGLSIEAHRYFRLAEPVFASVVEVELASVCGRLKRLLERAPAEATAREEALASR